MQILLFLAFAFMACDFVALTALSSGRTAPLVLALLGVGVVLLTMLQLHAYFSGVARDLRAATELEERAAQLRMAADVRMAEAKDAEAVMRKLYRNVCRLASTEGEELSHSS